MKKRTVKAAACAAIMAFALSMTACGSNDAAETVETEDAAEVSEPEAEEEAAEAPAENASEETPAEDAEAEEAGAESDMTLEDYFGDPETLEAFESAFSALAGSGLSISCETKGNELTLVYKFEDSSVIVDGLSEQIEAGIEENADTFKEQAKGFDEMIGQEGACTLTVRYTDPDDNVLAERSFTAD